MKDKPVVSVFKSGDKYELRDAAGTVYGKYDSKKLAEEAADGWNEYYKEDV